MKKKLVILFMFIASFSAFSQTWTGAGTNTNWNNTVNWNNNLIPTATDDVIIHTGFTVTLNVNATIKSIKVEGNSTFNINNNLSFLNASTFASSVTVNWSNGIVKGGGTLTNNGTVNLITNGSRYISGATTVTNNGLFTMPGAGYLYLFDTSVFINTVSGVFDLQSDAILSYSGSTHSFNNFGILKKTAGVGLASFQAILNNTGTISVESGTLSMNALDKTFSGGVYNVTDGNVLSLDNLINVSGTLTGALNGAMNWKSNLSVATLATFNFSGTNPLNWNSGTLMGAGTLTNNGKISLLTNGSRYILGGTTLKNVGIVTMPSEGYLYLYDTSIFDNTSTGIFDIQSDATISYSGGGTHNFKNAGLLKKTTSDGNAQMNCYLTNTGIINVESGTLTMNALPKTFDGGIYNVTSGNQLILGTQINISKTLTGLLNGALTWKNNLSVPSTATFNFTGSTQVNWNSGILLGGGTLINACTISLTTNGSRYVSGNTTLRNSGLVTMPSGGYLYLFDTSILDNTTNGIFNIQSDVTISYSGGDAHNFNNSGLLKKTSSAGNSDIQCSFSNTGIITVESGTLTMNYLAKIFDAGVYNVNTGCQMILGTQINVFNTLTGVLDGAITWINNVSVASNATFNFTGTTGVNWNSGFLIGGGTLTNASTINLTTNGSRYLSGTVTTLANTGTINMPAGGFLYLFDDTILDNKTTGVIDIQSNFTISYSGGGAFKITNAGLIKKTAGAGSSYIYPPTINSGTIDASSGILTFVDGKILTNTVDGIIKGTATVDLPAEDNFINNGIFAPGGSPGVLKVLGNYRSSPSSVLNVELKGLTQSTDYDLLAITGTAISLEGSVLVSMGFEGAIGNQFIIATISGTISVASLQSPIENVDYNGFRYTFKVSYPNNNTIMLTIVNKQDILSPNVITQNRTVQLNGSGFAIITAAQINNGSTDNVNSANQLQYSLDLTTFGCAQLGSNTVQLTVTDLAGNFATMPATVTVVDTSAPTITCASDFTVESQGMYTLPDYFINNKVVVSDNCGIMTKTQSLVAGTMLGNGVYTILFEVFDASGNSSTCFFKLTVEDTSLSTDSFELSDATILAFPNPVVNILTIKNNSNLELLSVDIIDVSGKIINTIDLSTMGNSKELSLKNYSAGMYFLKINTLSSSLTKRIIKK